jgi:protein-disulfide isomerase
VAPKSGRRSGSNAVAAARGTGRGRAGLITGIVIVVVVAVAVAIGVAVQTQHKAAATGHRINAVSSSARSAPVALDKTSGTVTVGVPTAPVTIDVYEDFLCPVCGGFEHEDGDAMRQAVVASKLRIRYHVVNLLDDRSNPPGYSMRAATAALAVADADPGAFASFHDSLYADQPAEGSAGYDANQLEQLAKDLGVPAGRVSAALTGHTFDAGVQGDMDQASSNPALQRKDQDDGSTYFGTPTVAQGAKTLDVSQDDWLTSVLAGH